VKKCQDVHCNSLFNSTRKKQDIIRTVPVQHITTDTYLEGTHTTEEKEGGCNGGWVYDHGLIASKKKKITLPSIPKLRVGLQQPVNGLCAPRVLPLLHESGYPLASRFLLPKIGDVLIQRPLQDGMDSLPDHLLMFL
jgi:hypothetical protein